MNQLQIVSYEIEPIDLTMYALLHRCLKENRQIMYVPRITEGINKMIQ